MPGKVIDWMIAYAGHLSYEGPRGAPAIDAAFKMDLENALGSLNGPAFVRTRACSFKQPHLPPVPLRSVDEIVALLSEKNSYLAMVLSDCKALGYSLALYLSEWRGMSAWAEFRVFIKERKTVGVSQYHHHQFYPEIGENLAGIQEGLGKFAQRLLPSLHLDDVVADVLVLSTQDGTFLTPN